MKLKMIYRYLFVIVGICSIGIFLVLYMLYLFSIPVECTYPPVKYAIKERSAIIIDTVELPRIAEDVYVVQEPFIEKTVIEEYTYPGKPLTAIKGVCDGPSGKETWYNLPMSNVIASMRKCGYSIQDYPYDIRDDGVKTLGDYVMVAADLNKYKKGDIVETSLGLGIVCDTGEFTETTDVDIDIATVW